MIVIVKNKGVASLPLLYRLIFRFIYERHTMRLEDIHLMMDSMVSWSKKADITEEEQYTIEKFATLLKQEEEGKFERRKMLFKERNIDWKKFHRLPEVQVVPVTVKDPYLN